MKCPRCQHDNPSHAKFCLECGARVALLCAKCQSELPSGAKFCLDCGGPVVAQSSASRFAAPETYTPKYLADKILTSKSVLEGERKQVTVLFVDVSGFTALAEKLDPEDVHQVMDRAFELMLPEIHRYEGTVNQFLGDGLMALFGAPLAHEDHPVRAVHAALGIQRALSAYRDQLRADRGIDFRVRMGLNSGAVVVGKIGDNLRMDYTAVGDTTNLAARLLGVAEPGQVLVAQDTAKVIEPYFFLQTFGEVAVKGKALPVRAFRVEAPRAVRSRIEAVMERGLTPLVGRERELALLGDRFDEVRSGRGQAVFVFGEAGIGKSRLLIEFRKQAESAGAHWLTGRCISYGRSMSYLPVLDLVQTLLGLDESDSVETRLTKVAARIYQTAADLGWAVPLIRALVSLDPGDAEVAAMNPHQRRSRIVDAVRAVVLAESRRTPLVIAIEDLHWIDSHSEEVLRLLLEGIARTPVLVLLTHRPGYSPPFGDHTYYSRITLHRLPDAQTRAMVEGVLQTPELPGPIQDLIAQKAEGNPLFIEELGKALVEDGTLERVNDGYRLTRTLGEVTTPDTIQGVLMARLDRLPESAKTALQVASVIGREFSARLVERVLTMEREADKALGELRAVELIYEKTIYPELAYIFKHALTHDVAYESLLRQRRRALHARAGEVIEELYSDRLPEFYETLAWHYTKGEAWPKAADYLLKAANKARSHYAYPEATRRCTEAIEILGRCGARAAATLQALEMLGDLESLQGNVGPANQAYDRACGVSEEVATSLRIANKLHRPGTVMRDGARIAYYEHGSGEPTLFVMQPVFYGLGTYQPLVDLLCQEFRIITVDPRGAGRSDPIPAEYLLRDHAEDARAVIEATGERSVVFLGISRAAALAVMFAATYPHLVEKAILIGTPPAPPLTLNFPGVDHEFWQQLSSLIAADDYDRALPLFWSQELGEEGKRDLVHAFVQASREIPVEVFRNFFSTPDPGRDVRPLLPMLHVPTLVLHGENDRIVPLEAGRYVAQHIPGAEFYVFKGRGHLPAFTATVEFAQVVRNFIRTGRAV